ncbi:unnamed protein product [Diplocarpon coronariae]|uniref:Uncharacterized protein n=1 Tax=Diplocarpon coronariae TaxID=2795749 RepID=A0A218ZDH6_9HELO|nr:hypothetical protein JHW43_005618 [Diplocarpon mali]OWP05345.1 hypothetical protein B2J93_8087 [Marssonina coronariae]
MASCPPCRDDDDVHESVDSLGAQGSGLSARQGRETMDTGKADDITSRLENRRRLTSGLEIETTRQKELAIAAVSPGPSGCRNDGGDVVGVPLPASVRVGHELRILRGERFPCTERGN